MRQKATRFSIQSFDNKHYQTTEQYALAVDALFDAATKAISKAAAKGKFDPDKPFVFDDYPSVKAVMQDVSKQLASRLTTVIETGSRKQWLFACEKNDGFIDSIMDTSKLSRARLKKMQDRNLDVLSAFQGRKVDGMNLSQRVWRYVGQYREQMESALDVGLGEGRSAQQLARDVKQNLKDPNRLFRRVRDKHGNLVLSKAAKVFHPGRGVYRSSVKNAQRLTRSEINMAYRESDWQRWQSLDFVVGFEIVRSNHEPLCKCEVCEKLKGRYPKAFKFKGWHPQCMCYAIPILMDEETFGDNELGDLKAALRGTTYKHKAAANTVVDVPDGFKEWVQDHIKAQERWATTPYFIKDNFVDGLLSKGLLCSATSCPISTLKPQTLVEVFKGSTPQEIQDFILQHIADTCTLEIKKGDIDLWNDIVNQLNARIKQFGLSKFANLGKPASRKAEASWDEFGNNLNLNITSLRNRTGVKVEEKWAKKGILYSFGNKDASDYVRAIIDHEIGHAVWAKYGSMLKRDLLETFSKAAKSVIVNGKSLNEVYDILGYYASTDELEYFAEAFSFYMGKNRAKLGTETKAFIERFLKKSGAKIDGTAAKATPKIDPVQQQLDALQPQIASIRQMCSEWGLNTYTLDTALAAQSPKDVVFAISTLKDRVNDAMNELKVFVTDAAATINEARTNKVDSNDVFADLQAVKADKRDWLIGKATMKQRLEDLKAKIKALLSPAHPAILSKYDTDAQVNTTFKTINSEFKTEKWFEHGDLALTPTRKSDVNGFTYMDGRISLTPDRLERVKSALSKIGSGKPKDITFEEADAMATFWHEITHNRNVPGYMRTTSTQTDVMEMMNEFVARKTLPEFYAKLGCKDIPHPEFITNRASTGYNRRILGYDFVIQKLGLDPGKVLKSARKNLFTLKYSEQETTATQALVDGGLDTFKGANGKKIDKAQLNKIVAMCRMGYSTATIENYLKDQGII